MELTKEMLEKRLADIKAHKNNLLQELNATVGAEQECEHWISELEKQNDGDAS